MNNCTYLTDAYALKVIPLLALVTTDHIGLISAFANAVVGLLQGLFSRSHFLSILLP